MPDPIYDTSAPVLVTGATGYLAGWIVKGLLDQGFTVHGTVRDPDNAAKVGHLTALAEAAPDRLKLFKADLLTEGAFDAAMAGCGVVFHTASPFTSKITDPQRDLVDPAVKGTRNVLASANRADSVRRVVVTSSCAAIYGDGIDCAAAPNGTLTEAIWNTTSTLDHNAYSFSKAEAEKAAWEIAKGQSGWSLVTVNPSLILGPGLAPEQTSESFNLVRQLADGTMKAGAPDLQIGMVDVRDVAEAHLRAGFIPDAEGRHITSAGSFGFLDLAGMLRARQGDGWPFPRRKLPRWLLWLVGPFVDKSLSRSWVSRNIGQAWKADNGKSKQALGLSYRPIDAAINEMFGQMVETGAIRAK